jgi:hypothetical protein
MEDNKITKLQDQIQAIRDKRAADQVVHNNECKISRESIEHCEKKIQNMLNNSVRFAPRKYKKALEDAYGGLRHAPTRYVLEQQAKLLSLSHQYGILEKELERGNKYKIMMVQYMMCEQYVLKDESHDIEAELRELTPIPVQEETTQSSKLTPVPLQEETTQSSSTLSKRNEALCTTPLRRSNFLRNLSPCSIFKNCKFIMAQYMTCEKRVLRDESRDIEAELREMTPVPVQEESAQSSRAIPQRSKKLFTPPCLRRADFFSDLSSSSIFKRSSGKLTKQFSMRAIVSSAA